MKKIEEKILKTSNEDKLLRECCGDLIKISKELEKTIDKINYWQWDVYEKFEMQFLKEYDELAKKYGEEFRNIDELPNLVTKRLEINEKIQED